MPLKWGIVSVGKISNDFTKSLGLFEKTEHQVVAVAARDKERAEEFAKAYNIPKSYGDYESLAKDSNIDIVYVGTIHPLHLEVSKLMLENGKHVLCEKPLTMNEKQTTELINLAKEKKRFLMEGLWSRCFPAYDEMKKRIDSGAIGDVKLVEVPFGRNLGHIERIYDKSLGGGTILDLGVYNLQFQQLVFKNAKPEKFVAAGHLNSHGTDQSANLIMTFPDGKTALLCTHSVVELSNEAVITGTKGVIKVPMFWCPTKLIVSGETLTYELPPTNFVSTRPGGFTYEIAEVRKCIKQGLLESPKVPHEETLQLAKLMDMWRQQIGVVYECDKTDS